MRPSVSVLAALSLGLAACSGDPPPEANVLVILVDTLRADHLGCYGYERATSPHMDQLAREGVLFEAAQAPRAKTTPSVASLMTGRYPHEHGVRDLTRPLRNDLPTLAEVLAKRGFQTAAVIGNYVMQAELSGLDRGFQTWIEELPDSLGVPPDDVPERRAGSLTDAALELLDGPLEGDAPWFLYLHYMDPHGSYDPPPAHQGFDTGPARPIEPGPGKPLRIATYNVPSNAWTPEGQVDAARVVASYDGEIAYADAQIGRLLEHLEAKGALEDTWVVLVADHGESLGEHNYWFEHGRYAYQATCRVPLIVSPPRSLQERPPHGRRTTPIALNEVPASLCTWLGLKSAAEELGTSRAELLYGEAQRPWPVFGEKVEHADASGRAVQTKTVRRGRYKLIQRHVPSRTGTKVAEELYDLDEDPLEARDLLEADAPLPAVVATLREDLAAFTAADAAFGELDQRLRKQREQLPPEVLRALEGLGYQ